MATFREQLRQRAIREVINMWVWVSSEVNDGHWWSGRWSLRDGQYDDQIQIVIYPCGGDYRILRNDSIAGAQTFLVKREGVDVPQSYIDELIEMWRYEEKEILLAALEGKMQWQPLPNNLDNVQSA